VRLPPKLLTRLATCLIAAGLLVACAPLRAPDPTDLPTMDTEIVDRTDTLDRVQSARLVAQVQQIARDQGLRCSVLVIGSSDGMALDEYAARVNARIPSTSGQPDPRVLLVVATTDRHAAIAVGERHAAALPQALRLRVVREFLAPRVRDGDLEGALRVSIDALAQAARGEPLPASVEPVPATPTGAGVIVGMLAAVLAALLLRAVGAPAAVRMGVAAALGAGVAWSVVPGPVDALAGALFGLLAGAGRGGRFLGGTRTGQGGWSAAVFSGDRRRGAQRDTPVERGDGASGRW